MKHSIEDIAIAMTLIHEGLSIQSVAEKLETEPVLLMREICKAEQLGFAAWH
ncbi:helix-turn-helix domain protein [Vibrio phage PVP-XSN]|uniref:Helix-turn-helix domain protein n=1 Tax=Vibrio phage PVP-XSN TaxID=3056214 RepID=A0AAX3Y3M4_9CAUD|nr:helix-turn-helix domain protein [Vibrio phage PVP-XSN]